MKSESKTLKAVIYARYSSDNQREESVEAQIRACKYYAQKEDIEIVKIYTDKAKSGKFVSIRKQFLRMIEDSSKDDFDIVLVHKLNRFMREGLNTLKYKSTLERNKVSLVSVTEKLDNSPEGKLMLMVIAGMNEFYSANLANEVMKGLKENAYNGKFTGGIPPLGYDIGTDNKLVINAKEAEAVQLIFKRYIECVGYTAIINELNNKGYKTKRGNSFGKNSLHEILKNEKYKGVYVYNKVKSSICGDTKYRSAAPESEVIKTPDVVPAIISEDDFALVQSKMEKRKPNGGTFQAKETYLLSGKIKCGVCGSKYNGRARKARPNSRTYTAYKCSKKNGAASCCNPEINRDILENFVLDKLSTYLFDEKLVPKIAEAYTEYVKEQNSQSINQKKELEKSINDISKGMENIISAIMKTGSDTLVKELNSLEIQKKELQAKYDAIEDSNEDNLINEQQLRADFKKAKKMLKSGKIANKKAIIEQYVKCINIHPEHIEIEFDLGIEEETEKPQNQTLESLDSTVFSNSPTHKNNVGTEDGAGEGT